MSGLFFSVSSVSFQALFISLHLLIITLFQEDNIFDTNASLTYGPQICLTSFLAEAELRKFKSQYIVRNCGTSSHRLFCVRKQNY